MRTLALLFAFVSLAACTPGEVEVPVTQVLVHLEVTADVQTAMQSLRMRASAQRDGTWKDAEPREYPASELRWPVDIPLVPREEADASQLFEVVAEAIDAEGKVLVQTRAVSNFEKRKQLVLTLTLKACGSATEGQGLGFICEKEEACRGEECLTCVDGMCTATRFQAPEDSLDGGMTSLEDAGPLPPPTGAIFVEDSACEKNRELGCADYNSAIQLICSKGKWTRAGTCTLTQRCNTERGKTQGLCAELVELCVDAEPNTQVCAGSARKRCGPDRITLIDDACPGGHTCVRDADDRVQCQDIDECADPQACHPDAACENTTGGFTCVCKPGMRDVDPSDLVVCEDIDECAETLSMCSPNATCVNSKGSFACACNAGTLDVTGDASDCATAKAVAVGVTRGCALLERGDLYCWGGANSLSDAARLVPQRAWAIVSDIESLSMYGDRLCAVAGGKLWCGSEASPLVVTTQPGLELEWSQVSLGTDHQCALRKGAIYCWGQNYTYQLGDGTQGAQIAPRQIGSFTDWTWVSAGDGHTCGIRGGAVYCWGKNDWTQASADGLSGSRTTPTLIAGITNGWTSVSAGYRSTCGVRNGSVYCWGYNNGTSPLRGVDNSGQTWTSVEVAKYGASEFYCGVRAGWVYCAGGNGSGQLGDGKTTANYTPTGVPTVPGTGATANFTDVAVGQDNACALRAGAVYCWGDNKAGQLGNGSVVRKWFPQSQSPDSGWTAVSIRPAGSPYYCGIRSGALYCNGSQRGSAVNWSSVSNSVGHTCGIRAGALYCWGNNESGQLGSAASDDRVGVESDWQLVVAYHRQTCGIRAGALYCWGDNQTGQLGFAAGSANTPTQVGVNTGWTSVTLGQVHTCGIREGALYCWGQNGYGQLGTGPLGMGGNTLLRVGSEAGWQAVAAGISATCGVRAGSLWCWGQNFGSTPQATATSISAWSAISVGTYQTCGLSQGALYCTDGASNFGASSTFYRAGFEGNWTTVDARSDQNNSTAGGCGLSDGRVACWGQNTNPPQSVFPPTTVRFIPGS